jgi:hypothetical protein
LVLQDPAKQSLFTEVLCWCSAAVQFATNHLGHFALVQQLLPILKATGKKAGDPARVVVLSSAAHFRPYTAAKGGPVRLDNISSSEGYDPQQSYVGFEGFQGFKVWA